MQPMLREDQNPFHVDTPMLLRWHGQLPLLSYRLFAAHHRNVVNIVSTRRGGSSPKPYDSLNLALSTPDDPQLVLENRRRLCAAIGVELEAVTIGQLVQGTKIAIVTEELRGCGSVDRAKALAGTDGLVTDLPDTPLAVLVADCAVVSYYDSVRHVVALAHAGWRGTAGLIAKKMVALMKNHYGSDPRDILVGISPTIGADHFQVREDVLQCFRNPEQSYGDQADAFFTRQADDSYLLDLKAALLTQLLDAGIQHDHIEVSGLCTACCTAVFYSHRAEHSKTGRFCGLIALRSSDRENRR
jgi:YfiH family protein